jgi:hypothetical protein
MKVASGTSGMAKMIFFMRVLGNVIYWIMAQSQVQRDSEFTPCCRLTD